MRIFIQTCLIAVGLLTVTACDSAESLGEKPRLYRSPSGDLNPPNGNGDGQGKIPPTSEKDPDGTKVPGDTTSNDTGKDTDTKDDPDTTMGGGMKDPVVTANLVGGINLDSEVTRLGTISGYAVDTDKKATFLSVKFYMDGDNKAGKLMGTAKANLAGSDENNGSEHAFLYDVPPEHIDGKSHKIYAYFLIDSKEVPLSAKMPYEMTFYKPKGGAAKVEYEKIGVATKCVRCHKDFNYESMWEKIAGTTRTGDAWSATKNYLYDKAHENHRGGDICNSIGNCDKIVSWWNAEFK